MYSNDRSVRIGFEKLNEVVMYENKLQWAGYKIAHKTQVRHYNHSANGWTLYTTSCRTL